MGVFGGIMKSFEAQVNKITEKKENIDKTLQGVYIKRKYITKELKENDKMNKDTTDSPESLFLKNTADY